MSHRLQRDDHPGERTAFVLEGDGIVDAQQSEASVQVRERLTMHAWQFAPFVNDLGLFAGKMLQAVTHKRAIAAKVFGQSHIGRVMPSFTFEKAAVKVGKRVIATLKMLSEKIESLTASRFDQASDE